VGAWLVIVRQHPERQLHNASLLLVIYGFAYLGAHTGYAMFEAESVVSQNMSSILDFRSGGLSAFGAIWAGLIGFFLGCAAQQRHPFEALDQIAVMLMPLAAFASAARWLVDAALYRQYPDSMTMYLPQSSFVIPSLPPPYILLLSAILLIVFAWLLGKSLYIHKIVGLFGNLAFTIVIGYWAILESNYGFFRFHPGFSLFLRLTLVLPILLWVLWLWLCRNPEGR